MKSAQLRFEINGIAYQPPVDWANLGVVATFEEESENVALTTEDFTFILDAYRAIKRHIEGSLGVFEGLPFRIFAYADGGEKVVFDGFLDTAQAKIDELNGRIDLPAYIDDGVLTFTNRLDTVTFAILSPSTTIVSYQVIKPSPYFEVLTLSFIIYSLGKTIVDETEKTSRAIAIAINLVIAGITGAAASAGYIIAEAAIKVAYLAALAVVLATFVEQIFNLALPPVRSGRGATLRSMLNAVCEKLGYTFISSIDELDKYVYLPSNNNFDDNTPQGLFKKAGVPGGVPNPGDYGYTGREIFDLCKNIFNAKVKIEGTKVYLEPKSSVFWNRNSVWNMPKIQPQPYGFNFEDLNSTVLVSFRPDITDEWTIKEFGGTNYEVRVEPINGQKSTIKGYKRVDFPMALGNRKDKLSAIEESLKPIFTIADALFSLVGKGKNKAVLKNSVGVMKTSTNNWSLPKLLYIEGGRLPSNHRSLLSAEYLYDKYLSYDSFVRNGNFGQKLVYTGITVPFGFNDFALVVKNSYFTDYLGRRAKITSIRWNMTADTAEVDFEVRTPYTKNLKEAYHG
jgi:hypothetical protein